MKVNTNDGYIICFIKDGDNDLEYNKALNFINNKPIAPDGYYYRLTEGLEWVLCKAPIIEEEATEDDYQNALREMGVEV